MKKIIYFNALVCATLLLAACGTAPRDGKPYLVNAQEEQKAQWRNETWQVADWAPTTQGGQEQIDAFFRDGVLVDYIKGGTWDRNNNPILIVGPGFYHLSGYDQTRVIDLFNHIYHVTETAKDKKGTVLSLKDWHTGRIIGVYGRAGLQLS